MSSKKSPNPYTPGSKNRRVVDVLLRSKKPLPLKEVAKRCKLPLARASQVLSALSNPMHNSVGRRSGLAVIRSEGLYAAQQVEPQPDAKRPPPKKAKKKG